MDERNDDDNATLEHTAKIEIHVKGEIDNAHRRSALCRIVMNGSETDPSECKVRISILGAFGNEKLCSWMTELSRPSLQNQLKMEAGDTCATLWKRLKEYLSFSNDDNRADPSSPVRVAPKNQQRIITEWFLPNLSFNASSSGEPCPELGLAVKWEKGKIVRNLWETSIPPTTTSSPSTTFDSMVLNDMLDQVNRQNAGIHKLTTQLESALESVQNWKQTAALSERALHQEKAGLFQNFLKLYNSQQQHVEELQLRIKQLEQERRNDAYGASFSQKNGSKNTQSSDFGVPDDVERGDDPLLPLEHTSSSNGVAEGTTTFAGVRRNRITGALECSQNYDDDELLFGLDHDVGGGGKKGFGTTNKSVQEDPPDATTNHTAPAVNDDDDDSATESEGEYESKKKNKRAKRTLRDTNGRKPNGGRATGDATTSKTKAKPTYCSDSDATMDLEDVEQTKKPKKAKQQPSGGDDDGRDDILSRLSQLSQAKSAAF